MKRLIVITLMVLAIPAQAQFGVERFTSEKGRFVVTYESQLDPIAINQIHSWVLHVVDADGNPVTGAEMDVEGGMPEHNHGLATSPDVRERSDGDYLLQGLRFHMMGYWELELTITAGGVTDTVVIPLEL